MEGSSSHLVVVNEVVTSIENELKGVHSISNNCCIYRVPYRFRSGQFRKVKEEAYTPKVVSIGPLHYGNKSLQNMEDKKKIYLNDFLQRNNVSLRQCVETVEKSLERLRSCYEENLGCIKDDELVKIIVVDAVFVIETLLKLSYPNFRNHNDRMFSPLILPDVWIEFLLLENQLPFFILEDLFQFTQWIDKTLIECCYTIFGAKKESKKKIKEEKYKPKHLVDLRWKSYEPLKRLHGPQHETRFKIPQLGDQEFARIPNATQLHQAGVKLVVRKSTSNSFDICFNKGTGTLEIPKLLVTLHTDSILRNLIAFEQCHDCGSNYLSDYVVLLDEIVNTPKDVDLLVEKKIIVNLLGQSEDASNIINRVVDGVGVNLADGNNSSYDQLRLDVINYCETRWHPWEATLKQKYFNTPWAIISFLAAFVLIVLTIIQTVCSVISTRN